jgi:hypothetical protein
MKELGVFETVSGSQTTVSSYGGKSNDELSNIPTTSEDTKTPTPIHDIARMIKMHKEEQVATGQEALYRERSSSNNVDEHDVDRLRALASPAPSPARVRAEGDGEELDVLGDSISSMRTPRSHMTRTLSAPPVPMLLSQESPSLNGVIPAVTNMRLDPESEVSVTVSPAERVDYTTFPPDVVAAGLYHQSLPGFSKSDVCGIIGRGYVIECNRVVNEVTNYIPSPEMNSTKRYYPII